MEGKQALNAAENMLRMEEEGGIGRAKGLKKLIDLADQIDQQNSVVDALIE